MKPSMEMKLAGKVKEAHGLRGELYIFIFSGDISWLKKLQNFELRPKGSTVPGITYPVEKVKPFKKGFILKTPSINDRTQAEGIQGQDFLVAAELFVSKPGETIFLKEILDFMVKDVAQTNIGPIKGFSSNGPQDLLVVETAKGPVEIPFVEAFIKKIDFKHKTVVMDLPEGLLDLENL
jgi:16S rRNA processing protein RimM